MKRLVLPLKFAVVGLLATAIHALVFGLAVTEFQIGPVISNTIAFVVAFVVSFSGHRFWTFKHSTDHATGGPGALFRFCCVALFGYALNSVIAHAAMNVAGHSYQVALAFMLTVTPIFLFVLSKEWAFRADRTVDLLPMERPDEAL